jgi:hypothetical protein
MVVAVRLGLLGKKISVWPLVRSATEYAEFVRDGLGWHKSPRAQHADRRATPCFDQLA